MPIILSLQVLSPPLLSESSCTSSHHNVLSFYILHFIRYTLAQTIASAPRLLHPMLRPPTPTDLCTTSLEPLSRERGYYFQHLADDHIVWDERHILKPEIFEV